MDSGSSRIPMSKLGIRDSLLLRLLSGESRDAILKDYEPAMLHRQEYWMAPAGSEFDRMETHRFSLSEDYVEKESAVK